MLKLFISLGQNSALELPRKYKKSRNDGDIFSSPDLNIFIKWPDNCGQTGCRSQHRSRLHVFPGNPRTHVKKEVVVVLRTQTQAQRMSAAQTRVKSKLLSSSRGSVSIFMLITVPFQNMHTKDIQAKCMKFQLPLVNCLHKSLSLAFG